MEEPKQRIAYKPRFINQVVSIVAWWTVFIALAAQLKELQHAKVITEFQFWQYQLSIIGLAVLSFIRGLNSRKWY